MKLLLSSSKMVRHKKIPEKNEAAQITPVPKPSQKIEPKKPQWIKKSITGAPDPSQDRFVNPTGIQQTIHQVLNDIFINTVIMSFNDELAPRHAVFVFFALECADDLQ